MKTNFNLPVQCFRFQDRAITYDTLFIRHFLLLKIKIGSEVMFDYDNRVLIHFFQENGDLTKVLYMGDIKPWTSPRPIIQYG